MYALVIRADYFSIRFLRIAPTDTLQNESQTFKMQGMERHFTPFLNELLDLFPCVGLVGVRQSGKTTTLAQLDKSWQVYDLENASDNSMTIGTRRLS